MMKTTIPAKQRVICFDNEKLNSKFGGILREKTRADLIGHLKNIHHFKNRSPSPENKVTIMNYDEHGRKVKFKKHEWIDCPD